MDGIAVGVDVPDQAAEIILDHEQRAAFVYPVERTAVPGRFDGHIVGVEKAIPAPGLGMLAVKVVHHRQGLVRDERQTGERAVNGDRAGVMRFTQRGRAARHLVSPGAVAGAQSPAVGMIGAVFVGMCQAKTLFLLSYSLSNKNKRKKRLKTCCSLHHR